MDEVEWQCPSCTLINKAMIFKCRVCNTPKGTSTRQNKFHYATVKQQYVAETIHKLQITKPLHKTFSIPSQISSTQAIASNNGSVPGKRRTRIKCKEKSMGGDEIKEASYIWPTLPNVDRTKSRSYTVTVDSVSVVITEFDFLYPDSD